MLDFWSDCWSPVFKGLRFHLPIELWLLLTGPKAAAGSGAPSMASSKPDKKKKTFTLTQTFSWINSLFSYALVLKDCTSAFYIFLLQWWSSSPVQHIDCTIPIFLFHIQKKETRKLVSLVSAEANCSWCSNLNVIHQPLGQAVPYWHKLGTITPLHKIFWREIASEKMGGCGKKHKTGQVADAERQCRKENGEKEMKERREVMDSKKKRIEWRDAKWAWRRVEGENEWQKRRGTGRWHKKEKERLEKGVKWRKRGVMFHFSSTNHQRRPTTGLPVGQDCWSDSLRTHTQCELDPFHLLPSQTVLLMVKTAEGIPMSKTNE